MGGSKDGRSQKHKKHKHKHKKHKKHKPTDRVRSDESSESSPTSHRRPEERFERKHQASAHVEARSYASTSVDSGPIDVKDLSSVVKDSNEQYTACSEERSRFSRGETSGDYATGRKRIHNYHVQFSGVSDNRDKCQKTETRDSLHSGRTKCSEDRDHNHGSRSFHQRDQHSEKDYMKRQNERTRSCDDHAGGSRCKRSRHDDSSSSSSESDSDQEKELTDYEFDWESHKSTLAKIFFRDEDPIQRNTQVYDDFWVFLQKYQSFQRKKASKELGKKPSKHDVSTNKLDLPKHYDKRYRINLALPRREVEMVIREARGRRGKDGQQLTVERTSQFKQILLHYLDFLQKQKFSKLVKIRTDQRNLPMFAYKEKVIEAVRTYPVVVVAGDTGCGKSTQVPQYLLEAGFTQIACTQPRRIACISLSKRVAFETLNEYGSQVAFQVRFERSRTAATRILFLTEGLLLRQIISDSSLSQYSVVVIDEVHERHINTDFLLGVLKCLITQRKDLKLVLMSATININLFSDYFDNAPVLQVPGRLYPIQLQYCPIDRAEQSSRSERLDPSPFLRILQLIDHKYPENERGDVLMFLSGMSEIMSVVEAARDYAQKTNRWIVLPLHSALSVAEQDKVFDIAPDGVRKCIVSTNIAETSVTIDGVRFVVDSGKVKEMSFDPKYKMQRLREFWISRASSEQRKGRAGRTGPGTCFRLYGEQDYEALQGYSTPEIQRVPLDSLILQMMAMGLPDPRKFPFIEPPSAASVENSVSFLKEQGALTGDELLTPIGEMLAQLPVDVVIGKMLIMGTIFQIVDPVLSIAAALSVQSPFTSQSQNNYEATKARRNLESDHGDPFTLLNALDEWIQVKADSRGSRKWCKRRGLEEQRFYEMMKLKTQFKELLQEYGLTDMVDEKGRYLTQAERQKKNAERRKLRELKRDAQRNSRKRKVLKLDHEDYQLSGGEEEGNEELDPDANIKDLEFRLTHDLDKIQEQSNDSRSFTLRDINVLKIILCSGLYPQLAIADEHNSFKSDSEQTFHTKNKGFVMLHPTSVFSTQPDLLQFQEHDIGDNPTNDTKDVKSNKHQLLAFVSLLETTKPYLIGVMRTPALQTLALYARSIDTNTDCTRLVFDSWLELKFSDAEAAEQILSSAVQLRATWTNLIQLKLQVKKQTEEALEVKFSRKARKLEKVLSSKLAEFLDSNVSYSLRRVLSSELAHLYRGPDTDTSESVQSVLGDLCKTASPHPVKGGLQVNDYLTFNCLQDDATASVYGEYTTYMQRHWTCSHCGEKMVVTVVERLQHEQDCLKTQQEKGEEPGGADYVAGQKSDGKEALRKPYHCTSCDQNLTLTPTEVLKHRKTCVKT